MKRDEGSFEYPNETYSIAHIFYRLLFLVTCVIVTVSLILWVCGFVSCSHDILGRVEKVIEAVLASLSKDEAPALVCGNRTAWTNVRSVTETEKKHGQVREKSQ